MHIISDSFGIFIDCFFFLSVVILFFWCQNLKTDKIFNNHKWHSKCLPINSISSDQMSTHTTVKINIQRVKGINQNSIQFFQIFGIHFKYLSISQKIHTNQNTYYICSVQITQLFFYANIDTKSKIITIDTMRCMALAQFLFVIIYVYTVRFDICCALLFANESFLFQLRYKRII